MQTIEEMGEDLKKILSEKRYNHSIGVMEKAEELAMIYGVNIEEAKMVGLMHDIAKEIPDEEKLLYAQQNNIDVDETEKQFPSLLHGKIGADICNKKYGFNSSMQDAIKNHTTGAPKMDMLSRLLYMADKTEKNRTYPELKMLQELTKKDIDAAILFTLNYVITKKVEEDKPLHINTILTRNEILASK